MTYNLVCPTGYTKKKNTDTTAFYESEVFILRINSKIVIDVALFQSVRRLALIGGRILLAFSGGLICAIPEERSDVQSG